MATAKTWFTVGEAAEYLGVSRRTVYRLCQEGRLAPYVLGESRTRRFRRRDLDNAPRALQAKVGKPREGLDFIGPDPVLMEIWNNPKDAAYDSL